LSDRKQLKNFAFIRNQVRGLWLSLVLVALFAAVVSAPRFAAAQAVPPPDNFQAAAKIQPPAKAEAKSEAEEANEFRHSATVQWVSKLIHVDVETTAKSFEFINFGIVVLAVGIPLFKFLPKVMRKRTESLSKELETARTATADANSRLSAVEARLAGLDDEIAKIRQQVEDEIREDGVRIKSSIAEESARIVAAAEQEIVVAAAQAQRELKQYATDLAIDRALAQLTFTPETESALITEFAQGSLDGSKRGQN
jgi:F-type H+-transporting ATPase subunit b